MDKVEEKMRKSTEKKLMKKLSIIQDSVDGLVVLTDIRRSPGAVLGVIRRTCICPDWYSQKLGLLLSWAYSFKRYN